MNLERDRRGSIGTLTLPSGDGSPSGQVGVYANKAGVKFDYLRLNSDAEMIDLGGRWLSTAGGFSGSLNAIDAGNDRLKLFYEPAAISSPILLKGVRARRFEATFSVRRDSVTTAYGLWFVFNARDHDHYDKLSINHGATAQAPFGFEIIDGAAPAAVSETRTDANMPTPGCPSRPAAALLCLLAAPAGGAGAPPRPRRAPG